MTDSNLRTHVEEYLSFRRGLGFDLRSAACHLRNFACYAEQIGHRGPITVDLATRWALRSRSRDPAQAVRRLAFIRVFARHRALIDPATEVPPVGLLGRAPRRRQPHIYSDAEICSLLQQASRMRPRGGLCAKTYVAFFALLVSTGLRLSEACRLTCGDVDLDRELLTIRKGKFRKSRSVPLHRSTTRALTLYVAERDEVVRSDPSSFFFCTERASMLRRDTVQDAFGCIRRRLGWTAQGRARRPRIHDIRQEVELRQQILLETERERVLRVELADARAGRLTAQ